MKLPDRLLLLLQRCIPARTLGNLFYVISRSRVVWFKNALTRGFVRLYSVNTEEAAAPVPDGYRSFNDFFTRDLKVDARPLCAAPGFACPADGRIAQMGYAAKGQLLQAKGMHFSAAALLGDTHLAARFDDAAFATIYLAPFNYHRVHMPLAGWLATSLFIPGKLYSVNARTAASLPQLYALNERLVCHFESDAGPFVVVLVGAMNVASISTAWDGEISASGHSGIERHRYSAEAAETPRLARGEYLGHFNMGSTVILLGPPGQLQWDTALQPGTPVQVGQSLGHCGPQS